MMYDDKTKTFFYIKLKTFLVQNQNDETKMQYFIPHTLNKMFTKMLLKLNHKEISQTLAFPLYVQLKYQFLVIYKGNMNNVYIYF